MKGYNNQISLKNRLKPTHQRISPLITPPHPSVGYSSGHQEFSDPAKRFSVIGKLEQSVSALQIARGTIEKTKGCLVEMKEFLEKEVQYTPLSNLPSTVINNFLSDRLNQIEIFVKGSHFEGKALLNGKSGVKGETDSNHLYFVRGSARVVSSEGRGYPVTIINEPKSAYLLGSERVSTDILKNESMIVISEGSLEIKYRIQKDETPDSLVQNLQSLFINQGIDISIFRTVDDHLLFKHNQLGSTPHFKGLSYKTGLVSQIPGEYHLSRTGQDVSGTIGMEPARGDGGFLIGQRGNYRTDGLIVYFDGQISTPGERVGYVKVYQNGRRVPLDAQNHQAEILSLPSLVPHCQAIGVGNRSGFKNLGSIRANTPVEKKDTLKLIVWSLLDLGYLSEELKRKENSYVELAMELLKATLSSKPAGDEILYLSKEKAGEMADELKTMMTPSAVMKSTLFG